MLWRESRMLNVGGEYDEETRMDSSRSGIGFVYGERLRTTSGGPGQRAGGKPGDDHDQVAVAAIPEEHGGCGRFDAARQVFVQGDAREYFVRAHGRTQPASQQSLVRADFGWDGGRS